LEQAASIRNGEPNDPPGRSVFMLFGGSGAATLGPDAVFIT
jgi:hypothetical protein